MIKTTHVMLGSSGAMAKYFYQLPYPWIGIDIESLKDKRYVHRAVAGLLRGSHLKQRGKMRAVLMANLPLDQYQTYQHLGERAIMRQVMGFPSAGQGNTLLVYHTSVQTPPLKIFRKFSGAVLGVHLMHGPKIKDLSKQTAIITHTEKIKSHHLYEDSLKWLRHSLNVLGYGTVSAQSPETHDKATADSQFLTHSMFLLIAELIRHYLQTRYFRATCVSPWANEVLQISQRILSMKLHVYQGIALSNPMNKELLLNWTKRLQTVKSGNLDNMISQVIQHTREASEEHLQHAHIRPGVRKLFNTPVSIVRDHYFLCSGVDDSQANENCDVNDLFMALDGYEKAVVSKHGYKQFFLTLQCFYKDREDNYSADLISKYQL